MSKRWIQVLYEVAFVENTFDACGNYAKCKPYRLEAEFAQQVDLDELSHDRIDTLRDAALDDLAYRFGLPDGYYNPTVVGYRVLAMSEEVVLTKEQQLRQMLDWQDNLWLAAERS